MKTRFYIILTCLFLAIGMGSVYAQDSQSDQRTLLPDINPQDIEIRSQFQARFPGLRRQPILGFNPNPRVFQLDPNRMPFIEDEESIMANLPIGELDRPEPPEYESLGYTTPENGFVRAGIGSYMSPEADVYAITRAGNNNWLSANANFTSSEGHIEEYPSSYRFFDGGANLYSKVSDNTTVRLNAGGKYDFNHYPEPQLEIISVENPNTRVESAGFYGGVNVDVSRNSLAGFRFSADGFSTNFDLSSAEPSFAGNARDWGANVQAEYSRLGQNVEEVHRVRITSESGGMETLGNAATTWTVTGISGHYERLFNYKTDVKASFGVAGVSDAFTDFTLFVTPKFEAQHTLFHGLDIRGELSGMPKHNSLSDIHNQNRFYNFESQVRHQYDAQALAEIEIKPFEGTKVVGGISYKHIKNYLYYSRSDYPGSGSGLDFANYELNFQDATFMKIHGGFSQELNPDVFWVQAEGYWQRPRLTGNQKIPFIEAYSIKGTASFRPIRQLLLEGWTEYTGSREDARGNNMSSILLLGSRFELSITENAGIYGKLLNLLDQEYELWQGYPERGFQAYVGFTYLF